MSARTVGIRWKCVVFWGLIAWLSLSVLTYLFAGLLVDGSWEGRGQVGDMFGVVNSLISGAALVGVIAALFLQQRALEVQREDLKATQEELKLTREEHSKAAQAQAASAEQMGRQAESLKVTALVNAISSMLDTYNSEVGFLFEHKSKQNGHLGSNDTLRLSALIGKRDELMQELEAVRDEKSWF